MTYYIRHKETKVDLIVEEIDIPKGIVVVQGDVVENELRLVDVIEEYEFRYDIW